MAKTCEILITEEDGSVVAGHFALEGGEITAHPKKGYEDLLERLLDSPIAVEQGTKAVTAKDQPEQWLAGLPTAYSGSYLRARTA
jgi:hypothetical protein